MVPATTAGNSLALDCSQAVVVC